MFCNNLDNQCQVTNFFGILTAAVRLCVIERWFHFPSHQRNCHALGKCQKPEVTTFVSTADLMLQWLNQNRVESEITDWLKIGKKVQQGCLISPLSFSCYSEQVMRQSVDEFTWIGITISGRTINNLLYADDSTHSNIARSIAETCEQAEYCIAWVWAGDQHKENQSIGDLNHGNCSSSHVLLEQVKSFCYLSSIITDTCDCRTEITARLGMASPLPSH